jgi:hypothetical protein
VQGIYQAAIVEFRGEELMSITSSSTAAATISGAAWCGMWPTPLSIISFADGNVAAKTRALISGDTIVSRSPMIITVGVRHGDATRRQRNGGDNLPPPRCRRIGDSDIFRMGRIGAGNRRVIKIGDVNLSVRRYLDGHWCVCAFDKEGRFFLIRWRGRLVLWRRSGCGRCVCPSSLWDLADYTWRGVCWRN